MEYLAHILFYDNDRDNAAYIKDYLEQNCIHYQTILVYSFEQYQEQLTRLEFDLVIVSYSGSDEPIRDVIRKTREENSEIHVIIIAPEFPSNIAMELFSWKIQDLVLFTELQRLLPAVELSISTTRARKAKEADEKKRQVQATLESLSLLQATLESTADGILVVGMNKNIVNYNRKFLELWNIPDSVVASDDDDLLIGFVIGQLKFPEQFLEKVRFLYSNPHRDSFDTLEFIDGRTFERYSHPQYLDGIPVGRVWSFREVTERKKAEQQNTLLAQTLKSAKDFISVTDLKENIIFVNDALLDTHGYLSDELIGKKISILRSPENVPEDLASIHADTMAGGWHGNLFNKKKDGTVLPVEIWTSPVYNSHDQVVALVEIARDISELKAAEEELRLTRDKAEESSRLKSSILANISHELRTPMNGILGYSELLREKIPDRKYKSMADAIYASGSRLMATLDSIVELAQLESDKKTPTGENVNISEAVGRLTRNYTHLALEKNIDLLVDITDDLHSNVNIHLFNRIIDQLLDNAFKFTLKGCIEVSVRPETGDEEEHVVVRVKDTGIGIAKEHQSIIFDDFRQVSEGIGRYYEGMGIGLSLSSKIVSLLNGNLDVESEPGKGSTFTVRFPLFREKKPSAGQEINLQQKSLDNTGLIHTDVHEKLLVVLLVEDNNLNIELMEMYLKNNYNTDKVFDATSALDMVKKHNYDAILLDINLTSGMDGLNVAQTIKNIPGYENTPIIAVTGYTSTGEREYILSHGCSHYLPKPFSKQNLTEKLREALEGASKQISI